MNLFNRTGSVKSPLGNFVVKIRLVASFGFWYKLSQLKRSLLAPVCLAKIETRPKFRWERLH